MTPHELLHEMLTYRRPAGSKAERKFIRRFLRPLGVEQDGAGNLIKRIGDAPVMWSSHTDTVHKSGGRQATCEDTKTGYITAINQSCLGADDTVGVWLMVEMIKREVPGLYIFHRAEEIGAYGSMHIANATPRLLAGIQYAIALDRKGTKSIVTNQMGSRCCSDAFANALGKALDLGMSADDSGVFTDTVNYIEHVPECTNISVGYYDHHTAREKLFVPHAMALLEALCALDVSSLPVERIPGPATYDDDADQEPWPDQAPTEFGACGWNSRGLDNYDALRELCKRFPDEVADFLDGYGITADEIMRGSARFISDDFDCERYAA